MRCGVLGSVLGGGRIHLLYSIGNYVRRIREGRLERYSEKRFPTLRYGMITRGKSKQQIPCGNDRKKSKNGRSLREREAGSSPSATLRVRMTTRKARAKAKAKATANAGVSPLRAARFGRDDRLLVRLWLRCQFVWCGFGRGDNAIRTGPCSQGHCSSRGSLR